MLWADADPRRAQAFLQSGKAISLIALIERMHQMHPGHLLEAELEEKPWAPSGWVFEIKWLGNDGIRHKYYFDAVNGELLRQQHKGALNPSASESSLAPAGHSGQGPGGE